MVDRSLTLTKVDAFTSQRAEIANKETVERVMRWQTLDTVPEGHSIPLLEIGQRILEGEIKLKKIPETEHVPVETSKLVKQAQELAQKEEKLRSEFPAAAKVLEPIPERETESEQSRPSSETGNGHDTEDSGVLVEKDQCLTPPNENQQSFSKAEEVTPVTEKSEGVNR